MESADFQWLLSNPVFLGFIAFFGISLSVYVTAFLATNPARQRQLMWLARFISFAAWLIATVGVATSPPLVPFWWHRVILGTCAGLPIGAILLWMDFAFNRKPTEQKPSDGNQTDMTALLSGYIKPEPNLIASVFTVETVEVYEDENGVIIEGAKKGKECFKALVLSYHNSPHIFRARGGKKEVKQEPGDSGEMVAQIQFKLFQQDKWVSISNGVWLNEQQNFVTFTKKHPHHRVIMAIIENEQVFGVERQITSKFVEGRTHRKVLDENTIRVSVGLLNSDSKRREFIMTVTREPKVDCVVTESHAWIRSQLHDYIIQGYNMATLVGSAIVESKDLVLVAEEVATWEAECAVFLKTFISEQKEQDFLKTTPSIESGLKRERNLLSFFPRVSVPGQEAQITTSPPQNWNLMDSIKARIDKLQSYQSNFSAFNL